MTTQKSRMQVSAAINHAARTFMSFDRDDWLAMAEKCRSQAEYLTCIDCGCDCSVNKPTDSTKSHHVVNNRWSCR